MMTAKKIRETDLYLPIKALLEGQGYEVKSEVGDADVVAVRGKEAPVIVELKLGFSLSLFHQGIERQNISDSIYIAVPHSSSSAFAGSLKKNMSLCRRLGLGLLTVRLRDSRVVTYLDPAPYKPRKSAAKKSRLLKEFEKRVGDPNVGGSTRRSLMTAYRQEALRCLQHVSDHGPTKASTVSEVTGVPNARRLMADDHYGWFERVERGVYGITPCGERAVREYAKALLTLKKKSG